jgi:hypothetical protein
MSGKRPNILSALLVLLVVGGLIYWWVNAIPNEDPLWFLKTFSAKADWIVVYWDGNTHMFFPGDAEYDEIMTSFSQAVARWTGYENGVGLSEESLDLYRNKQRMLEFHYNEPVRVHTRHLFSKARYFWIPLSGTHANWRRVFSGLTDQARIGVLNVSEERFATLLDTTQLAVAGDSR